jgi:hypothetical protein
MYRRISQNMMCDAEILVDTGYHQMIDESNAYLFSGNIRNNYYQDTNTARYTRLPNINENTAVCSCPIQTRGGNGCQSDSTTALWPYAESDPIPFQRWSRHKDAATNNNGVAKICSSFVWEDSQRSLDRSRCRT